LFFLRVEKRGLEFPLHNTSLKYRRVFLVPNMVLAVIDETDEHLVVEWHGPTLQTEYKDHQSISPYSESISFVMDVPKACLADNSVVRIEASGVTKMKNHVPAILY